MQSYSDPENAAPMVDSIGFYGDCVPTVPLRLGIWYNYNFI